MSRKEALKLKKERARLGALEERLDRLFRQGADDSFLEQSQGRFSDLSPAAVEVYGQVVDRALRSALAAADWPRLARLLPRIDKGARSAPLAALAQAAVHLAEGRLDAARAGFAALPAESAGSPPWRPGLATALTALCAADASAGSSEAEAVQRFHRALAAVEERAYHPRTAEIEELRRALEVLRTALPSDPALSRLLEPTQEHLRLLTELAGLEKSLQRKQGAAFSALFRERLRALARPLLAVLRDGPPAALLHPLHHALRLRWRDLLALVAEREGDAAWAGLHASWPALLALDLELAGGPERLKSWAAIRELREAGEHRQLARLLGSLGNAEKAPERMTLLWSLELWAWDRAAAAEDEDDEPAGERPDHAALVRLGRMAADVAGRLPSEQRPEAARFLRARLYELLEQVHFCDHAMAAADALLQHLPADPGLLLVALAGAATIRDGRAQRMFAARLDARGEARSAERDTLLALLSQIVLERADVVLGVLPHVRRLLGEAAWPQARETVLESLVDLACGVVGFRVDDIDLSGLAHDVASFRPVLAASLELDALEAALDCLRLERSGERGLRHLLDRSTELAPAVVALRVLAAALTPWAPPAVERGFELARSAAISRLDLRWRLWSPALPGLLIGASRSQARQLRDNIGRLLKAEGLQAEDRRGLEEALAMIDELQRLTRALQRESKKEEPGRRPRKRRRRGDEDQLSFDLS